MNTPLAASSAAFRFIFSRSNATAKEYWFRWRLTRLRSADEGRESVAESGEKRLAKRSRSGTPPPFADGSVPLMRFSRIRIVTSTRFAQRNRRGGEGERADRKPVKRANRVLVTTANRTSTRQRVFLPAALAFFHLALAAAEIRARPSALILRLFLVRVAWVPVIFAHLARAAAAILALPAADILGRFLPATSGVVVPPKMDASWFSSCSICSLMETASRSCATLKLLRGVIKVLVVRHIRNRVDERDCDPSTLRRNTCV